MKGIVYIFKKPVLFVINWESFDCNHKLPVFWFLKDWKQKMYTMQTNATLSASHISNANKH